MACRPILKRSFSGKITICLHKNDNENTNEIEISTFEALLRNQKLISSRVHPNVVESESLQIFRGCDDVMLHIKVLIWLFFWKHMAYIVG